MQIYLPIAELPVNILIILAIGLAVGFISGMFGVGGGFLTTPLLIFYNIPPVVAVATSCRLNCIFPQSLRTVRFFTRRGSNPSND